MRAKAAEETQAGSLVLLCLAAWAIPGVGHLWQGRRTKGLIFLIALPLMFAIGLAIQGRLFPFELSDPLVGLACLADFGIGIPNGCAGRTERMLEPIIHMLVSFCSIFSTRRA